MDTCVRILSDKGLSPSLRFSTQQVKWYSNYYNENNHKFPCDVHVYTHHQGDNTRYLM